MKNKQFIFKFRFRRGRSPTREDSKVDIKKCPEIVV